MTRTVIRETSQLADYKPRIALIADEATRGAGLLIKLIKNAGGKPMVLPHVLTDRLLASQGLDKAAIEAIKRATSLDEVREYETQINAATKLHMQYIARKLPFVDGVILPGSDYDIPPSIYHETQLHELTHLAPPIDVRFKTELVMADYALHTRKLPILGISSGMHLLVVKTGGKLLQHIADYSRNEATASVQYSTLTPEAVRHLEKELLRAGSRRSPRLPQNGARLKMLEPRSILGALLHVEEERAGTIVDGPRIGILNLHHQGVRQQDINSSELKITAIDDDGLVEAVEHRHHPFCLGVQFHPEYNMQDIGFEMVREIVEFSRALKLPLREETPHLPNYLDWKHDASLAWTGQTGKARLAELQ